MGKSSSKLATTTAEGPKKLCVLCKTREARYRCEYHEAHDSSIDFERNCPKKYPWMSKYFSANVGFNWQYVSCDLCLELEHRRHFRAIPDGWSDPVNRRPIYELMNEN